MCSVLRISHAWVIKPAGGGAGKVSSGALPEGSLLRCWRCRPWGVGCATIPHGFWGWMAGYSAYASLVGERPLAAVRSPAVIAVTRRQSPGDKSLTCSDRPGADGCW